MRHLPTALITLILCSCGQQIKDKQPSVNRKVESVTLKKDELWKLDPIVRNTVIIPENFTLDTLIQFDSLRILTSEINLPRSNDEQMFAADQLLQSIINKRKTDFIESVDQRLKKYGHDSQSSTGNTFRVWPEKLYRKGSLLSFLFAIESYFDGAAHPTTEYYSFNYNIRNQKPIYFNDYFSIRSKADADGLTRKINTYFDNPFVRADKFYPFDFNFDDEKIYFNFDDYEIASYADGIQRAEFDKTTMKPFVFNTYLK